MQAENNWIELNWIECMRDVCQRKERKRGSKHEYTVV